MSGWKPGDVARRSYLGEDLVSVRVQTCYIDGHQSGQHWHHADGGWDRRDGLSTYRPLVLVDPEDREQVERLRDLFDVAVIQQNGDPDPRDMTPGARGSALQAALREFANPTPPKPEEPQGLGAVVEDADGALWVHANPDGVAAWMPESAASRHQQGFWRSYDAINAVRVLSEGVRP